MSKIQKGKNLMVKVGGVVYGFATSCDLSLDTDTKEVTTGSYKHSNAKGQWKEFETDKSGWTANTDYLATVDLKDALVFAKLQIEGEPVTISFESVLVDSTKVTDSDKAGDTGTIKVGTDRLGFEGKAIINSFKLSAQNDSDATYSISLQGTGELKIIEPA